MTPEETKEQRDWLDKLAGHTPGPWTFEIEQDEWPDHALIGGDGDPVLSFDFDLGFRVSEPNARLITSAPDLRDRYAAALDEIKRLRVVLSSTAKALDEITSDEWLGEIDHKLVRQTLFDSYAALKGGDQ